MPPRRSGLTPPSLPAIGHAPIERFETFDALFDALFRRAVALPHTGGFVRAHPCMLAERSAQRIHELEVRLGAHGLRLLLSALVAPGAIELVGYPPAVGGDVRAR